MPKRIVLPSVAPVHFPVAVNAGQFVRNKAGNRPEVGTSLDYLLSAAALNKSGFFVALGDCVSFGFFDAIVPGPEWSARYSHGITHDQYRLTERDARGWDKRNAASASTQSYGRQTAALVLRDGADRECLAVMLANVRHRVSQLNPSRIASVLRKGDAVVNALCGDVDALAEVLRFAVYNGTVRETLCEARTMLRGVGAMFTL